MQPLFRRGLLLVAASPLCLAGAFFLARIAGVSIFGNGSTAAFWGVIALVSISVMLLPLGATMCAVALIRAGRAGEPFVSSALVACALVVGTTGWVRAMLARGPSPMPAPAASAPVASPVAAVAPHGGSGLLGLFLAVMIVVGAAVVMRRLRRMLE